MSAIAGAWAKQSGHPAWPSDEAGTGSPDAGSAATERLEPSAVQISWRNAAPGARSAEKTDTVGAIAAKTNAQTASHANGARDRWGRRRRIIPVR